MAITGIAKILDNIEYSKPLISVHNPLTFIVEVTHTSTPPDKLYVSESITSRIYSCIPYADVSSTKRQFMFIADEVIRGLLGSIDDEAQVDDTLVFMSNLSKVITLVFYDPAVGSWTEGVNQLTVTSSFAHASRQFGESPCLQSLFDNDDETIVGVVGMPAYAYYFNDNAANIIGVGDQTELQPPVIVTTAVTNIYEDKATSGGSITNDKGVIVNSRGVVWSVNPTPVITQGNDFTINGTGYGTFTSQITGLSSNTIYYVRAYAVTNYGTFYGNEVSFGSHASIVLIDDHFLTSFSTPKGITPTGWTQPYTPDDTRWIESYTSGIKMFKVPVLPEIYYDCLIEKTLPATYTGRCKVEIMIDESYCPVAPNVANGITIQFNGRFSSDCIVMTKENTTYAIPFVITTDSRTFNKIGLSIAGYSASERWIKIDWVKITLL